jgi:hypothetical protein
MANKVLLFGLETVLAIADDRVIPRRGLAGPSPASARWARPNSSPRRSCNGAYPLSRRTLLLGSSAVVGIVSLGSGGAGLLLARGGSASRQAVTTQLARATLTERAPAIPAGAAFPRLARPPSSPAMPTSTGSTSPCAFPASPRRIGGCGSTAWWTGS